MNITVLCTSKTEINTLFYKYLGALHLFVCGF